MIVIRVTGSVYVLKLLLSKIELQYKIIEYSIVNWINAADAEVHVRQEKRLEMMCLF